MSAKPRLCILALSFGDGGVERSIVNLIRGLSEIGVGVDLILGRRESPYVAEADAVARVSVLGGTSTLRVLPWMVAYLRRERPDVLLCAKEPASRPLLWALLLAARRLLGLRVRVVFRTATTISAQLERRNPLVRAVFVWRVRRLYRAADGVIAISRGVAEDLACITRLPASSIPVAPNPVVTPELGARADEPAGHPWLDGKDRPVVLGVGRLARTKDFPTLVRAFARVRARRPARLVILGDGRQRRRLERLVSELGLEDDVSMPGFTANPYPAMARADVVALTSLREGFGNVLAEALAVGTPVVATDCPSGPREILAGGRYGRLVPVGDAGALAEALMQTLDETPDRERLRASAERFTVRHSAQRYAEILGLAPAGLAHD